MVRHIFFQSAQTWGPLLYLSAVKFLRGHSHSDVFSLQSWFLFWFKPIHIGDSSAHQENVRWLSLPMSSGQGPERLWPMSPSDLCLGPTRVEQHYNWTTHRWIPMLLLEAPRMQHYCKVGWLSGYALHRINNSLTKDHENTIECQNKIWLKMTYKILKHERQSSSTQIYNRPFPQTNYQALPIHNIKHCRQTTPTTAATGNLTLETSWRNNTLPWKQRVTHTR